MTKDKDDLKSALPEFTTCLFLPMQKLHLIPFYDLYTLRDKLAKNKKIEAQKEEKNNQKSDYLRIIKNVHKALEQ